ncbi:hypothetical protein [Microseira wollei]|uniref:hypothetical protein n=1 Tax=Microseira wollei TaxID=467598 RepID=UPI001CFC60C5|nr:hypothetical protein [Microseira wollei]
MFLCRGTAGETFRTREHFMIAVPLQYSQRWERQREIYAETKVIASSHISHN